MNYGQQGKIFTRCLSQMQIQMQTRPISILLSSLIFWASLYEFIIHTKTSAVHSFTHHSFLSQYQAFSYKPALINTIFLEESWYFSLDKSICLRLLQLKLNSSGTLPIDYSDRCNGSQSSSSLSQDDIPIKLRCAICSRLAVNAFRLPCCDQAICGTCKLISYAQCESHQSLTCTRSFNSSFLLSSMRTHAGGCGGLQTPQIIKDHY